MLTGETERDIALVDVAVSKERFVGARAIWDTATLHEVFIAGARPDAIGLSAIGARLSLEADSLRIRIGGGGTTVLAPIAPGMVTEVAIRDWSRLPVDEPVFIDLSPCTIAPGRREDYSPWAGTARQRRGARERPSRGRRRCGHVGGHSGRRLRRRVSLATVGLTSTGGRQIGHDGD